MTGVVRTLLEDSVEWLPMPVGSTAPGVRVDCVVQTGHAADTALPGELAELISHSAAYLQVCPDEENALASALEGPADVVVTAPVPDAAVLHAALARARRQADARLADQLLRESTTRLGRVLSHDLSTPFRQIVSIVDLIDHSIASGDTDELPQLLELLKEAAGQGIGFSDALARLGRASRLIPDERVELRELLRSVAARFSAGCRCEVEGPTALEVKGDALRLSQVFEALIDNSVRHAAPPAGDGVAHLRVRFEVEADSVWMDFSDEGPGIPPDRRLEALLPFRRFGRGGEHGLGLAVVHDVVEAHGGEIHIVEPAAGSTERPSGAHIRIRLPLPDAGRTHH